MAETKQVKMAAIEAKQDIEIELSTRPALRLWQGREKTDKRHGIIGIPGFCKIMRGIELAVREDDPYADYHYHKVEQGIEELTYDLNSELKDIELYLSENTPAAMRLPGIGSKNPVVVPIRFASKLGFQLVYQLLKVDQVILKVLLANHIGLLPNKDKFETLARLERKVRSVLHLVFAYKHTGVTRDDMMTNNKKAQQAKEQMGELETGYLEGTLRSANAPPLPLKRLQTLGNLSKQDEEPSEVKRKSKTLEKEAGDDFGAELDRVLKMADAEEPVTARKKHATA